MDKFRCCKTKAKPVINVPLFACGRVFEDDNDPNMRVNSRSNYIMSDFDFLKSSYYYFNFFIVKKVKKCVSSTLKVI